MAHIPLEEVSNSFSSSLVCSSYKRNAENVKSEQVNVSRNMSLFRIAGDKSDETSAGHKNNFDDLPGDIETCNRIEYCIESIEDGCRYVAKALAAEVLSLSCEPAIEDLTVTAIHGGITNQLYHVKNKTPPEAASCGVLVRIFGAFTDNVIDREEEKIVCRILSEQSFGPKVYGFFGNGRVEEFLPSIGIDYSELGLRQPIDFPGLIAGQLAVLHHIDMPLEKRPSLWNLFRKFECLCQQIDSFNLKTVRVENSFQISELLSLRQKLEMRLPSEKNGYGKQFLMEAENEADLLAMKFLFETVFCHNDLLAGNILLDKAGNSVKFIDFEYSKYNFRGYDFANHFCEYAGFDFDFRSHYPDFDGQKHFIEAYIKSVIDQNLDKNVGNLHSRIIDDAELANQFYSRCVKWIDKFASASNFLWALWAIVQNEHSLIDFDYLHYAKLRLENLCLQ